MSYQWLARLVGREVTVTLTDRATVVSGQCVDVSNRGEGRARLFVRDRAWTLHEVDSEVVYRVESGPSPRVEVGAWPGRVQPLSRRRASRAYQALATPRSRPFVFRDAAGRWHVVHQKAPVGMRYDSLPDAMRVAAGCAR